MEGRTSYGFQQPYGSASLEVRPGRRFLVVGGGLEISRWEQTPGGGSAPSIETIYTPATLPGVGASPTYLHSQGTVGIDWRTSPGYARRGGFYGVTVHDFADTDNQFGFRQTDYDVVQHLPVLRETWVLSFHGRVETTSLESDQQIPFFMMPALGGGSSLRGFSSWRFRDRHSLLLQAEWRVIVNRFVDMAVFYDTGKTAPRQGDLNLDGLKSNYGLGFRLHGALATPLRIEFAKSHEGLVDRVQFVRRLLDESCPHQCFAARARAQCSSCVWSRRRCPHRHRASTATIRLARSLSSRDASEVQPWDIGLTYELAYNLFVTSEYKPTNTRAQNINTIDEVPDSSWFTNRIGSTDVAAAHVARGPQIGAPPAPDRWVILREKTAGANPGFTARDAAGETWFLGFDPPSRPEGATASVVIANKLFWALGYNQVEMFLTTFDPKRAEIDPAATVRRPSGERTPFTRDDMQAVLDKVARNADGTYRVAAGRVLPGKVLGGFRYAGTRPDDPNDIVPHEHRRELRALARLRRMDQPDGPESRQHTRHAHHGERAYVREALLAGRRVDLRHGQRPARVGHRLGTLL